MIGNVVNIRLSIDSGVSSAVYAIRFSIGLLFFLLFFNFIPFESAINDSEPKFMVCRLNTTSLQG